MLAQELWLGMSQLRVPTGPAQVSPPSHCLPLQMTFSWVRSIDMSDSMALLQRNPRIKSVQGQSVISHQHHVRAHPCIRH